MGLLSLGQVEPVTVVSQGEEEFNLLGRTYTELYALCEKYLNPDQCRSILGYKPVVIPMTNDNPLGLKWYWFILGGFLAGRVMKIL